MNALVAWIDRAGSITLWGSIAALLVIDFVAIAAVATTRDRALVNRWTGRVLGANLVLVGVGLTGKAVAFTGQVAVSVIGPLLQSSMPMMTTDTESATPVRRP